MGENPVTKTDNETYTSGGKYRASTLGYTNDCKTIKIPSVVTLLAKIIINNKKSTNDRD